MSTTETKIGKLIPVDQGKMLLEELIEFTCKKEGWKIEDYHNGDWGEVMDCEGYGKYELIDYKLYRVELEMDERDSTDIFWAQKDGENINFIIQYYNGGCSFSEAIAEGLKKLKQQQP